MPSISILLPFHDAAATLDAALASVAGQTFGDWECRLWDDGSADGSRALAAGWCARDGRFVLEGGPHAGIVASLQRLAGRARGALLARMDADDVAHPERLARQAAYLEAHPACALCGTDATMLGPIRSGRARYAAWLESLRTPADLARELFVECPLPHPTFLMRREAFEAVGGYRDAGWAEDYDLVLRLWRAGHALGKVCAPLLAWREHAGRLSMRDARYGPAAFRACKRHYLIEGPLRGRARFHQWGAGEVGKPWLREWAAPRPEAVVDIRPGKIGQTIHGYPVVRPEALPPPGETFIVAAVGTPGARGLIRDWLAPRGYVESEDFVFVA